MIGILTAALAGIILSFVDAGKKILSAHFQPEVIILLMNTFGAVSNLGYFAVTGFPTINWPGTVVPFMVCGTMGVLGEIFILKALKGADFSLSMPLLAFIPVFGALIGFILFSEVPSIGAGIGVMLVVIGAYLLGMTGGLRASFLDPIRNILTNSGCRYMIIFSFLCAAGCIGQRYGAIQSSPLFFFTLTLGLNWIVFLAVVLFRRIKFSPKVFELRTLIFVTGIFWAFGVALMFLSYNLTLAAYAGAAMQLGTVVSVVIGALFFKERAFKQRSIAGVLMVVGVVLVIVLH